MELPDQKTVTALEPLLPQAFAFLTSITLQHGRTEGRCSGASGSSWLDHTHLHLSDTTFCPKDDDGPDEGGSLNFEGWKQHALDFLSSVQCDRPGLLESLDEHEAEAGGRTTVPVVPEYQYVAATSPLDSTLFEDGLIRDGVVQSRVFLASKKSSMYCLSVLGPTDAHEDNGDVDEFNKHLREVWIEGDDDEVPLARRSRRSLGVRRMQWRWGERMSFSRLTSRRTSATTYDPCESTSYKYYINAGDPRPQYRNVLLDDPRLKKGKQHTVMLMPAYHVSLIPFVKPKKLKEELNEQFRARHPNLHESMTLSKLRNLKEQLVLMCIKCKFLDISTVAVAWVYFEQLVIKGRVDKKNRKQIAGTCLVLAYKYYNESDDTEDHTIVDSEGPSKETRELHELLSHIRNMDKKDRLDPADVLVKEFSVFAWLEFWVKLECDEVQHHVHAMLAYLEKDFELYYGSEQWWHAPGARSASCDEADSRSMSDNGRMDDLHLPGET